MRRLAYILFALLLMLASIVAGVLMNIDATCRKKIEAASEPISGDEREMIEAKATIKSLEAQLDRALKAALEFSEAIDEMEEDLDEVLEIETK